MQRFRLKADGRIVELRDGRECPLAPEMDATTVTATPDTEASCLGAPSRGTPCLETPCLETVGVRDLRRRARLTQQEFADKVGVPVETIRNWEQGKRMPRGPARALLAVIAHAPDTVFAALSKG